MANNVFANGREISCKAGDGKSIASFPDVCMTPPENPTTPPGVPIPYPNTGMASDTTSGSKKVKISDKEVMLKNKSYFKKSTGDEAGSATKKGVVTSVNRGKVYFNAWSMDVKVEGENVVRHLDLTTHNHASVPGNTAVWPYTDQMAVSLDDPCVKDMKREYNACKEYKPHGDKDVCEDAGLMEKPGREYDMEIDTPGGVAKNRRDALEAADRAEANQCISVRRCSLQTYKPNGCCPGQTPHHLVEASAFFNVGRGKPVTRKGSDGKKRKVESIAIEALVEDDEVRYEEDSAPCVCAEGPTQNVGTHGFMHTLQSYNNQNAEEGLLHFADGSTGTHKTVTYKQAKENAKQAMKEVFPLAGCDPDCIESQLDAYHNQGGVDDKTKIKAVEAGKTDLHEVEFAKQNCQERASRELFNRMRKAGLC